MLKKSGLILENTVSLTPETILLTVAVRVKFLWRTSFIIIRTMYLSSRNLSNLQLKSNFYEIAVSYAAVKLTNSTGLLFSLGKIVDDLY